MTKEATRGGHLRLVRTRHHHRQPFAWRHALNRVGSHAVPATGGGYLVDGGEAAEFPMVEVTALLDAGRPFVVLTVKSPLVDDFPRTRNWVDAAIPADIAHAVTAALFDAVCAGPPSTFEAHSVYGPAVLHIAPGDGAVTVSVVRDGATLAVSFRYGEARMVADAITAVASLFTGAVPVNAVVGMVPDDAA